MLHASLPCMCCLPPRTVCCAATCRPPVLPHSSSPTLQPRAPAAAACLCAVARGELGLRLHLQLEGRLQVERQPGKGIGGDGSGTAGCSAGLVRCCAKCRRRANAAPHRACRRCRATTQWRSPGTLTTSPTVRAAACFAARSGGCGCLAPGESGLRCSGSWVACSAARHRMPSPTSHPSHLHHRAGTQLWLRAHARCAAPASTGCPGGGYAWLGGALRCRATPHAAARAVRYLPLREALLLPPVPACRLLRRQLVGRPQPH